MGGKVVSCVEGLDRVAIRGGRHEAGIRVISTGGCTGQRAVAINAVAGDGDGVG